ncbi:hypothetical protein Tdes44962_MAKER01561, partial [Teratosphaeria destructans]
LPNPKPTTPLPKERKATATTSSQARRLDGPPSCEETASLIPQVPKKPGDVRPGRVNGVGKDDPAKANEKLGIKLKAVYAGLFSLHARALLIFHQKH